MIQGEKSQQVYKMNDKTEVTIKSKKIADDVFVHEIVLKHTESSVSPLMFEDKDQIKRLVQKIDMSDPQLNMFGR